MKCAVLLALACTAASAHVISMSHGFATVSGNRVDYLLRMPAFEMPKSGDPAAQLLDRIRFSSRFETARRTGGECHLDPSNATYVCGASYVFTQPPGDLTVECTFFEVTAPNHIQMLHAERAGKNDQAILDSSVPSATLLFRPPTQFERALEQTLAAARRTLSTWPHLLLLTALAVAARTRRELLASIAAFAALQCAACLFLNGRAWQPAPALSECAVALALAYLAFEMLVFPASGLRWPVAAAFGAFSGAYFASFIASSAFAPRWVLAGGAGAPAIVLLLTLPLHHLVFPRLKVNRLAGIPFLLAGCAWFTVRLVRG